MSDPTYIRPNPQDIIFLPKVGYHAVCDIEQQLAENARLRKDAAMWKANHDNQVRIKQAVLDRPDLGDRAKRVRQLIADAATLARAFQLQVSYQCACDDAACMTNTTAHRAMARNEANALCNQINAIDKETSAALTRHKEATP